MRTALRIAITLALVLVITDAGQVLFRIGFIPLNLNGFEILSFVGLLLVATICLPLPIKPRAFSITLIETSAALSIFLLLPLLIGMLWLDFTPTALNDVLIAAFAEVFLFPLTFVLSVFLVPEGWLRRMAQFAFVIYCLSVLADVLTRGSVFSVISDRPAGFAANPNSGAAQLALLAVMILPWERPNFRSIGWLIVCLVFVGATLSRSGLLLWGIVAVSYLIVGWSAGGARTKAASVITVVIGTLMLVAFVVTPTASITNGSGQLNEDRIGQLKLLLSGDFDQVGQDSRVMLLWHYIHVGEHQSVLGHGSAYSLNGYGLSAQEGPHNFYVARFVDTGIIGEVGLLCFIGFWLIFFMVYRHAGGIALTLVWAIYCIFSHNMDTAFEELMTFAVLAAEVAVTRAPSDPALVWPPRKPGLLQWLMAPVRRPARLAVEEKSA